MKSTPFCTFSYFSRLFLHCYALCHTFPHFSALFDVYTFPYCFALFHTFLHFSTLFFTILCHNFLHFLLSACRCRIKVKGTSKQKHTVVIEKSTLFCTFSHFPTLFCTFAHFCILFATFLQLVLTFVTTIAELHEVFILHMYLFLRFYLLLSIQIYPPAL